MDYSVFDFLLDAVFVLNEKKEIIYSNEVAANLCDSTVKRITTGKISYELLNFEKQDLFWMKNGSLGLASASNYVESRFENGKGQEGRAQVFIQPEPNQEKKWLVFIRDVSLEDTLHRKYKIELEAKDQAYRELSEAQDQLIQIGKMATLGQFVATVSHELNNPLAIVQGSAEELKDALTQRTPDIEIGVTLSDFILDASKRMIKILRNMRILVHGQSEKFNFEKTNIANLMSNAVSFIRNIAQKSDVIILNRCPKDLPEVFVDPGLIDQMSMNLIKNAIDALVDAGTKNPEVIVNSFVDKASNSLVLSIHDNGPGVPEKHRAKMFKPFFTTKSIGKGTGLGLMICQKIVERHGGKIELDANSKVGARFLIYLPINASAPVWLRA